MLKKLIEIFIKTNGRSPNALEMLQLKFKAAQQSGKGQIIQFPKDRITDWRTPRPTSELQSGIMKATGSKPTVVKTEAQIKSQIEKQNKEAIKRLKNKKKWDEFVKKDPFDGTVDFDPEDLAGGGIAGMLGEPTYQDEDHRIPLKGGKTPGELIDHGWDEDNPEHMNLILKLLLAGEIPKFADGGRIGFKLGGIDKARRAFLKMMGAGAAGVGAAKSGLLSIFKGSKSAAVKDLTQVPIQNAEGMPSWFKPLVNRVIKEGTDITKLPPNKGGAYLDRQIVHEINLDKGYNLKDFSNVLGETTKLRLAKEKIGTQDIKKLLKSDLAEEKKQVIRVYQNLDDQTINVEYKSADNMGGVDDAVHLEYRAPQDIYDTGPASVMSKEYQATKKASGQYPTKSKPEFEAHEAYPLQDPKDYKYVTFEGDNTVSNVDDLFSDTSALKQFGTNKALTKKELAIAKQKRQQVKKINENPSEELAGSGPDYDDYASGGRVPLVGGGIALKILAILKNPKKIRAAVDDIFPTGDYKYDAQMAAESLVENNPKVFGGKLMDDLDDATRSEVYGAVIGPIQQNALMVSRMKKASKPTKTLEGIEKTGTINISDPNVADEFARFMKETDPKGHKKIEEIVEITNFDPKGKKPHASGGRVSLSSGGVAGMLGE